MSAFGNDEDTETLSASLAAASGLAGPANVAECRYRVRDAPPPSGSFAVTVTRANDLDGRPVLPVPAVSLEY